jgi:chemotaxis family two-component system response regulator Rcp1
MGLRAGVAPSILVVEDNPADTFMVERAFRETNSATKVLSAQDGRTALELLSAMPESALPDVIVLDLNLPGKDGAQILREMRSDSRLRRIPVIVMSTSSADYDINRAYDSGANLYFTKPYRLDELYRIVGLIDELFFHAAQLPSPATTASRHSNSASDAVNKRHPSWPECTSLGASSRCR